MNDLKFAARQLLRSPGFTIVALLTLALGIGANAAIATMIDALVLKAIKAKNPRELAGIYQFEKGNPNNYQFFSFPDFVELRGDRTVFSDIAAFNMAQVGVREGELLRPAATLVVSANYFQTLGVAPMLGRAFLPEEEALGANTLVLSHSYWQKLGARADIVGTTLRLAVGEYTVVGVMPEGFTGTDPTSCAFFLPVGAVQGLWSHPGGPQIKTLTDRGERSFMLFGRLKPGADLKSAVPGVKLMSEKFRVADPKEPKGRELVATPLSRFSFSNRPSNFVRMVTPIATLAAALAIIVLAVACLNLANMLLARGASRRKEIAVRLAIGASRNRILRQLLIEGLLLAAIGSVGGLVIALWSTSAVAAIVNAGIGFDLFRIDTIPDAPVLLSLLALCGLATVFFALGPAWKLASMDLNDDLKQHGAPDAGERWGRINVKTALVVGQLALSLALLVAASLFTRSAFEAMRADPGFAFGSHFIARIDTGLVSFPEARARQIFNDAEERIAALPGVESVSSALFVPFGQESWSRPVQVGGAAFSKDDAPTFAQGKRQQVMYNVVGPDYFRTLGLSLLRGRDFNRSEVVATPAYPVAIISQSIAEKLWPGEDAVGRMIQFPASDPNSPAKQMQVVGVAPTITWDLFQKDSSGLVVTPRGQDFQSSMRVHVRVMPNADPVAIMGLVRKTLNQIDPQIPLVEMKPLKLLHDESMSVRITKIGAALFGGFGAVALLLSFIGVYGLKAYSVARRTREIGIRMALGATARDVIRMILGEGARMIVVGLIIGAGLALALGRVAGKFLYGVSGFDPITFATIPVALAAASLLACWLPARRATRVNPMRALRCE